MRIEHTAHLHDQYLFSRKRAFSLKPHPFYATDGLLSFPADLMLYTRDLVKGFSISSGILFGLQRRSDWNSLRFAPWFYMIAFNRSR